ncbi:hypothetical protein V7968_31865 [Nocardia vulneris]|uniref:hypothetical protein n=1 Tax=Nocardia vulneris TaxID=1141657 RepID=UPI0030CCBA7E
MAGNAAHDALWSFAGPVMARNAAVALRFGGPGVTIAMMAGGAVSQVIIDDRYGRLHRPEDFAWSIGRGALSTLVGAGVGNRIAARWGPPGTEAELAARVAAGRMLGGASMNWLSSLPLSRQLTDEARAGLHNLVDWTGDLIPTIDIGAGVLLPGMPDRLLMPGPHILRPESEDRYRSAPGILAAHWANLGEEGKLGVPPPPALQGVRGRAQSGIDTYGDLVQAQAAAMMAYRTADTGIPESVDRSRRLVGEAKKAIFDVVETLNRNAQTPPPTQFATQDEWTLHYLDNALHDAQLAMRKAHRSSASVGEAIGALANSVFRDAPQGAIEAPRDAATTFPIVAT